jgi:hypothetical protein
VVVDDQQRHRLAVPGQPAQRREPSGSRRLAHDPEVSPESPAEITAERVYHPDVVVKDE